MASVLICDSPRTSVRSSVASCSLHPTADSSDQAVILACHVSSSAEREAALNVYGTLMAVLVVCIRPHFRPFPSSSPECNTRLRK